MARSILVATVVVVLAALVSVPPSYGQASPGQSNPAEITPEQLKQLSEQLDRTIDQYMGWLTQMYQMTPEQQTQVRGRLQEVKQQHLQYGDKMTAEMLPLQQELRFYIEKARKGEPLDKEMVKDLQNRLTAVIERAPLTFNHIVVETEKLLPDEQVQAGRQRQEEFKERMKEVNARTEAQAAPPVPSEIDPILPYIDKETADGTEKLPPPQAKGKTGGVVRPNVPATQAAAPDSKIRTVEQPIVVAPIPLDEWGKYVEDFIVQYKLDSKQAQQCRQILAELRKRADEYRLAHKPDYAAAEKIKDVPARNEEISRLDKPIQTIFVELKTRLDNIPTDAQRKSAEAAAASQASKAPASRPVVPAKSPTKAPSSAPASAPARTVAAPK